MKKIKIMTRKVMLSLCAVVLAFGVTSCADYFDGDNFRGGNPSRGPEYDYLNDYADLREFVNRDAYPNFKLGGATDAASYSGQGLAYALCNANFDELVTGNDFKHASVVADDGTMDFSKVTDFAQKASDKEKSVYGHTLVWHAQQNVKYLNKLMGPVPIVDMANAKPAMIRNSKTLGLRKEAKEGKIYEWKNVITNSDMEGDDVSCFFTTEPSTGGPHPSTIVNGEGKDGSRCVKLQSADNPANDWDCQFFIEVPEPLKPKTKIRVSFDYKASGPATTDVQAHTTPGNYVHWQTINPNPTFTTDWQHYFWEGEVGAEWTDAFQTFAFNLSKNKVATTFWFDNVVVEVGTEKKVLMYVDNGDMEGDDVSCFYTQEPGKGVFQSVIVDGEGKDGSRCVKIQSLDNPENDWDTQFFIRLNEAPGVGTKLHVEFDYKSTIEAGTDVQAHSEPGSYIFYATINPNPTCKPNWQHYTWDGPVGGDWTDAFQTFAFNLAKNKKATTFWFDNVVVYSEIPDEPEPTYWVEMLKNNDLEGDDVSNYFTTEPTTGGPHPSVIYDGVGVGGSRGIKVVSEDNPANDWDTQFFIRLPEALPVGTNIQVEFDYRASQEGGSDTQGHSEPGSYIYWSCVGSPTFTPEWQHWSFKGSTGADWTDAFQTIAFNLAKNKSHTEFYFDNISFKVEKSGKTRPQTEEEIRDTITFALNKWIKGMMQATASDAESNRKGVYAWDLINEPMSDIDPTQLKSGTREGGDSNFYWQDYLGEDYAKIAEKMARQYVDSAGRSSLKLFVNDYNLEAAYNQNAKCDGLIAMIEKWEADGKTKIDGIGSQMHVTYSMNPATQKANEDAYVNMLRKLAATGKLIRISELDMGLADADGNTIKTADVTEEQHHAMAGYYTFIVSKYLEIIPAAQQWGICIWSITDQPENSGWRAGEPVGLWDINYYRKHTYAGFAEGFVK